MANHKSALKRLRQNQKIRERNARARAACRTAVKRTRAAIEQGDKETAKTALVSAQRILDSAARKSLYHKNNVSRRIGRLAEQIAKL